MRLALSATLIWVLVLAGGAGAPAMRTDEPPSVPPEHHSWGYLCPAGYPIIVYRGHYYPLLYPTVPSQKVKWTACFKTAAGAARAGYERMPTPRGFLLVEGFYLYPALNFAKPYCHEAAQETGFAVPCPSFTLGPPAGFVGCQTVQPCYAKGTFISEARVPGGSPPGYRGYDYRSCTPIGPGGGGPRLA